MEDKFIESRNEFSNGSLGRRDFLKGLFLFAGGAAVIPLLTANLDKRVKAQVVKADDARLQTGFVKYQGESGEVTAYMARPKEEGKLPGVIVIHENKGLQPHIEDVARRVALEGFMAIAPDALSPLGGTPDEVENATPMMRKLDADANLKNYLAAVEYLKTHPESTGKVGCMGFCWGGGISNQLAVNSADLAVAVPFYGRQPAPEDVPKIKAALLLHYAALDERINQGIPAYEKALKAASVDYQIFTYEGAGHAFFNDSRPERYHEEAARLAWERTIAFFNEKLKS